MRRWLLFIATNILVVSTITILCSILGVNRYISGNSLDYQSLFVFCMVYGMVGSFISLLISRWTAKMMMGVQVIDPHSAGQFDWLVQMVHDISRRAGLPAMPEVGVYNSPEVNAFATGPSKSRSLVAVSTGLLSAMNRKEIEGVLGHEVAHIQNGDMVTMTLIQGVINAFVMFVARVIAFAVSQNVKEENRAMINFLVVFFLQIGLSILGMLVVNWFSRQREFRADAGSAKLVGREPMIAGLAALQRRYGMVDSSHASLTPFKISSKDTSWGELFATHPPLEKRIAALQTA